MNRIKLLRVQEGLKQSELAKILNVSQSTLSTWETGNYEPDLENIKRMTDYFNTTSDYILGLSNDPTPPNANKKEPVYERGSFEWFRQFLTDMGAIEKGGDLTDEQLKIALANLKNLVRLFKDGAQD